MCQRKLLILLLFLVTATLAVAKVRQWPHEADDQDVKTPRCGPFNDYCKEEIALETEKLAKHLKNRGKP